ncbi:MAG: oxygen-insensitive NAD(P)H nitroreductase [Bacillota bacterium]
MEIINVLKKRYSTKEFDATKKLTDTQITALEDLLQLSPSSTNIQPWHFVMATTNAGKKRITKGTQGFFAFNEEKVLDASAVIIFASKVELTESYLQHVTDKENADGRFPKPEFMEQNHGARSIFAHMHQLDYKDFQHWADKQLYLNLGNFLLGVAALGLDAIAMEGFDLKVLDEEFGLREKGFTSSFVVAVGHHKESDFNKDLPKSRLDKSEIIDRI